MARKLIRKDTVYFIRAGKGAINIGITSKSIKQRMSMLQTGCPENLALMGSFVGCKKDEKKLHSMFKDCHVRGEWYEPSDELLNLISTANCPEFCATMLYSDEDHAVQSLLKNLPKTLDMIDASAMSDALKKCPRQILCNHFKISGRTLSRCLVDLGIFSRNRGPKGIDQKTVKSIRNDYLTGWYTQKELGDKYGVVQSMICKIVNNECHRSDLVVWGSAEARFKYAN